MPKKFGEAFSGPQNASKKKKNSEAVYYCQKKNKMNQ